jgi:hypothetical protein
MCKGGIYGSYGGVKTPMNKTLQRLLFTQPPIILPSIKGNALTWHDASKWGNVYYPLNQIVTNGNFASGTTGWTNGSGAALSTDNNTCIVTGNGVNSVVSLIKTTSTPISTGKKIYITAKVKVTNAACVKTYIDFEGTTIVDTTNLVTVNTPVSNQIYTLSGVATITTQTGNLKFIIRHSYIDAATANNKVMEVQNVMTYFLSDNIGAGNEPTAAEMDDILAKDGTPYWEGTRNVLCNPNGRYFWHDFTGNNRHIKLSNLAYTSGSTLSANGFEVDGVDDFGTIADSPATRMTGGGTIMAWIKPRTLGESDAGRIIDKSTTVTGTNGYFVCLLSNNRIRIFVNGGTEVYSIDNAITLNKWQYVVVTLSSTGRHIYVNGVDVTTYGGSETALPPDVAGIVCIGNRAGATDRTFDGYIDKLSLGNRVLSQIEIQREFQKDRRYYKV